MIPEHSLRYGYFLTAAGKAVRFFVLQFPFDTIASLLAMAFIGACVTAWRAGARLSLISLVAWWITAFVLFALPSLYFYLQGDAAIFI